MSVEAKANALLALVEADRAGRCAAIDADARARAAAIRAAAHATARTRMRDAFAEERARSDLRIEAAGAELATRRRLARQRRAMALLGVARAELSLALAARWHDDGTRAAWLATVLAAAAAALPRGAWRIAHPVAWPPAGQQEFAREVAALAGVAPVLQPDPGIAAGVKIVAGVNVIDGTADGLLADGAAVGARLLHHLDALSSGSGSSE